MIDVKLNVCPLNSVIWKLSLYEPFVWEISIVIIVIILHSYFYFTLLSNCLPGTRTVTFTQNNAISLSTYFITLGTCSVYDSSLPLHLPPKPCILLKKRFINFHLDFLYLYLSFLLCFLLVFAIVLATVVNISTKYAKM